MTFWDRHNEKMGEVWATLRATCSRLRSSLAARLAGFAASIRRIGADTVPVAILILCFVAVGLFGGL